MARVRDASEHSRVLSAARRLLLLTLRGLLSRPVRLRGISKAAIFVAIVMAHPGHREIETFFVATLWHQIKKSINVDTYFDTAPVGRVRVQNFVSAFFEDAESRSFFAGMTACAEVVN